MPRRQGNLDSAGQTEALPETTPPSDCGFLGVENLRIAYKNFKDGISDRVKDGDDLFCLSWLSPILCTPFLVVRYISPSRPFIGRPRWKAWTEESTAHRAYTATLQLGRQGPQPAGRDGLRQEG